LYFIFYQLQSNATVSYAFRMYKGVSLGGMFVIIIILLLYNNIMSHCYKFEPIQYDDGILNACVDATYIIHLEGNGRLDSIRAQLEMYHPSDQVYILFNKGYKKCEKSISSPGHDLIDAFLQCFQHAKSNGFGNILILEDDFIFSEEIKNKKHVDAISSFIHDKTDFMYLLGCLPFLQIPASLDLAHYHAISCGTHAVIYDETFREQIVMLHSNKISDWDVFLNAQYFSNRYCYYLPLCFQLFPPTDNSKHWGVDNVILFFLGQILFKVIQILNLNESIEPGYSIFYGFSKTIPVVFILLVLYWGRSILFKPSSKNNRTTRFW